MANPQWVEDDAPAKKQSKLQAIKTHLDQAWALIAGLSATGSENSDSIIKPTATEPNVASAHFALDHLAKAAADLDNQTSPDAQQALEGLDAVLLGCTAGVDSDFAVMEKLTAVAGLLDETQKFGAANILDKIALAYEFKGTPLGETRKELYDHDKHNAENMWEHVKREVAENRKQDNVETHRGTALSLSTRYSPELPGVQLYHVADGVYQDSVTKKIFDFNAGFTTEDGHKYPGGSVKHQTPMLSQYSPVSRMFDTRIELAKRRAARGNAVVKTANHPEVSETELKSMREWIADCEWPEALDFDNSQEFADSLSDAEVIKGVERHYEGGVADFLKSL